MNYLLSVGSNLCNRINFIHNAVKELVNFGKIDCISTIYETKPWGFTGENQQEDYLNLCLLIQSNLAPSEFIITCQEIEKKLGRIRTIPWASRTIDIDIILIDDKIIDLPNLVVPHPRMHLRNFVLVPASEICGSKYHPLFKKTLYELKQQSKDTSQVHFYGKLILSNLE